MIYRKFLKRIADFIIALLSLVLFSPIFILICILIKLDSKGPVFFRQRRIGKDKKEFMILKFRSMNSDAPKDEPTYMLKNPDEYITRVGKVLRKTSLDELPQLINIIIGQMSIVGPRPVISNEYDLITKRDEYGIYDVKPGLTGWAQINGRDEVLTDLKVRYDREYVEKLCFTFDLKCIVKTILLVLKADGILEGARADGITKERQKLKG